MYAPLFPRLGELRVIVLITPVAAARADHLSSDDKPPAAPHFAVFEEWVTALHNQGKSRYAANFVTAPRSDLKPPRISSESSCGCSNAAKCPPLGSLL